MEKEIRDSQEGKIELEHHKQQSLCTTRAAYRQGRKLTAIKTYTVNNESVYLLIFGVPKINLRPELKNLCQKYGEIKNLTYCDEYPTEDFTECFRVKYERVQSARIAKRMMDTKNFFGGVLHICYAPEFETLEETRAKLTQRRADVGKRLKINKRDETLARNYVKVARNNDSLIDSDANKETVGYSVNNGSFGPRSGLNVVNNDSVGFRGVFNVHSGGFIGSRSDFYVNTESVGSMSGFNVHSEGFIGSRIGLDVNNDSVAAKSDFIVNNEASVSSCVNNGDRIASGSSFNPNLDSNVNKKAISKPEYVFKRKSKKKCKNLDREIQKIKMGVREIGPVLNKEEASKKDLEAVTGRIVVCEKIEKPRIVKIIHKPMNKIVFNINNSKL